MNRVRAVVGASISAAILGSIYWLIQYVSRPGITSNPVLLETVKHFFTGVPLVLAGLTAILLGATLAVSGKYSGPLKVLQGVSAALYFFFILNGGMLSIDFASGQVEARVVVGLTVSLVFFEGSAIFRTFQGAYEYFHQIRA